MRWLLMPVLTAVLVTAAFAPGPVTSRTGAYGLTSFPDAPRLCGDPTKLFAKCRSQTDIALAALAEAKAQNKALLVEVGADWCVWCLVIDRYINGWFVEGAEPRTAGTKADAEALARFAAANFVVVKLDSGPEIVPAMRRLGIPYTPSKPVPAFYVVHGGKAREATIVRAELPARGEYRGYSRQGVLAQIRKALHAVRTPTSPPRG